MKKVITMAVAVLLVTGAAFAGQGKECCKKGSKKECCKKGPESKMARTSVKVTKKA